MKCYQIECTVTCRGIMLGKRLLVQRSRITSEEEEEEIVVVVVVVVVVMVVVVGVGGGLHL